MDDRSLAHLRAAMAVYAISRFLADMGEPRVPLFVRRLLVSLLDCQVVRNSTAVVSVVITIDQLRLVTRSNLLDPRFGRLPLTFMQQMLLRDGCSVGSICVREGDRFLSYEEMFDVDQDVVCEQICAL